MKAHTDEKTNEGTLSGELEGGGSAGWGATAKDGGPTPTAISPPALAREFEAEHVPCLRNCRHYFRAVSHFDHGNPIGTFEHGKEPTQRHHACSAIPGVYLELSGDSPVYECSNWDPTPGAELKERELRREAYYNDYPDHRPHQEEADDANGTDGNGAGDTPS